MLGFAALSPTYAAAPNPAGVAQDAAPAQDRLQTCAAISDSSARLACYDALAAQASAPAATPAPGAPASKDFGMPQTPEGVTLKAHLTTALDEVRKGGSVELDNGQRWKFIDSPGAYYGGIAAGTEVTITTTMTNGYRMSIQGVPVPLKVKRTR